MMMESFAVGDIGKLDARRVVGDIQVSERIVNTATYVLKMLVQRGRFDKEDG